MGLSTITNRVAYAGDGSSTIFSFPYYFFNQADLSVYLFDTVAGTIAPQTINTNYTIGGAVNSQGVYPSGGTVIMASSFPSNLDLVLTRSPSQVQNYVLGQNGQINSLALVQQFDYLTALVQRLQDEVSRCVQLPDGLGPVSGSSFSTQLPSTIAFPSSSAYSPIVVNSGATGLQLGFVIGSSGFAGIVPVPNGGTGQSAFLTPNALWYSNGSTAMGQTAAGTTNQVLIGKTAGVPFWGTVPIGSGTVSIGSGSVTSNSVFGVLPTPSGGTGTGSTYAYTAFGVLIASSATQFASTPAGGQDQLLVGQAGSAPIFGKVNLASASSVTNALALINGGTGIAAVSASTAFNALSPMTTGGDIIVGSGAGTAIRLANGNSTFVLTSQGGTTPPIWQAPAAIPNVNARYHGAGITALSGSDTPLFYLTKDYDTNTAYGSGGIFTVPTIGKYLITGSIQSSGTFALNNALTLSIYLNGSVYSANLTFAGGADSSEMVTVSDIINCSSGHTLQFYFSSGAAGPAIVANNNRNYFAITYIGS